MKTCKSCKFYWKIEANPEAFCVVNPPTPTAMVQQSRIGSPQLAVMSLQATVSADRPECKEFLDIILQ